MKKVLLSLIAVLAAITVSAQSFRDEIAKNPNLSASNYMAYPTPSGRNMQDPAGYEPVYISHYGRHGSRYQINEKTYTRPIRALEQADSAGILSVKGKEVLEKVRKMYTESHNRWGELTELGAQQHREIARRMYQRFPNVFKDSVWVDAKSTVVIRCILSMESELQELIRMNPRLRIRHDASEHDMYYMNLSDKKLSSERNTPEAKKAYDTWIKKNVNYSSILAKLFTKTDSLEKLIDKKGLMFNLFNLAGIVQNSEIRHSLSLYDLYTTDELYNQWRESNVYWYLRYAAAPQNGGRQPFSQRNLLRNIIDQADSCLALPCPGATLRFGHDTMVLPLVCLLGINGYDKQINNLDDLEKEGWINTRIFPMGCNVQFVFYKPKGQVKVSDDKIIVRVLLNEEDAKIPVKTWQGERKDITRATPLLPFYRWSDVKAYYNAKLASFRN